MMHISDWFFTLAEIAARGIDGSEEHREDSRRVLAMIDERREAVSKENRDGGAVLSHGDALVDLAADGRPSFLPGDGMSVWPSLSAGLTPTSERTSIIHYAAPLSGDEESDSFGEGVYMEGKYKYVFTDFQTDSAEWFQAPGQTFSENFTVKCPPPPAKPTC